MDNQNKDLPQLMSEEIELDPNHPGPANVRLRSSGVPVWAIIGHYLFAVNRDAVAVARDYEISDPAMRAALAYYELHRAEIDGRLADNRVITPG